MKIPISVHYTQATLIPLEEGMLIQGELDLQEAYFLVSKIIPLLTKEQFEGINDRVKAITKARSKGKQKEYK